MAFTGVRVEQHRQLLALRRTLTAEAYRSALAELTAKERRAVADKERRRIAREERERLAEIEEARRRAEREEAARLRRNAKARERRIEQRFPALMDYRGGTIEELEEVTKMALTQVPAGRSHIVLLVSQGGVTVIQKQIRIKASVLTTYYDELFHVLIQSAGSDTGLSVLTHRPDGSLLPPGTLVRVVLLAGEEIPAASVVQHYRDSPPQQSEERHCVLDPLIDNYVGRLANPELSKDTATRYGQIHHRLLRLRELYKDGVPEDKMGEIGKAVSRCIVMNDVLGGTVTKFNESSSKSIHFTNTRKNHVEPGQLTLDYDFERVGLERMRLIVEEHQAAKRFYHITGDVINGVPRSIKSLKGCWRVLNESHDVFAKFNKSLGLDNFKIDAVKNPVLAEFLRDARVIDSVPIALCAEPNQLDGVRHLDMEKAYTRHRRSPFYRGFPAGIQTFARFSPPVGASFLSNVGVYQFQFTAIVPLLSLLGFRVGVTYCRPSVEIEYFCSLGSSVTLLAGAWGSCFDIDYPEEMLEQKRYAIWAGKLAGQHESNTYTFPGDRAWAGQLKSQFGERPVHFYEGLDLITVAVPAKSAKTFNHVLAFITAYCRMNMMELMRAVGEENLVKVMLDGLYFKGSLEKEGFVEKPIVAHKGFRRPDADCAVCDVSSWPVFDGRFSVPEGYVKNIIVLTGAGGTGKSHSVLTNPAFVGRVLYIPPTRALGHMARKKYGCRWACWQKVVGSGGIRPWQEEGNAVPPVLFLDELTMVPKDAVEKLIAMYPTCLLFIAGDVDRRQWFQCCNGTPGTFSTLWLPSASHYVIDYTTDFRCSEDADGELLRVEKGRIRDEMRRVFTDGGRSDTLWIEAFIRKTYPIVKFADATSQFAVGDNWIYGTHSMGKRLMEAGVRSPMLAGDLGEVAGHTIHSFQGTTLSEGKIFISLDLFEYSMAYTAMSRGVRWSQIVWVG